ncbi:sodium:solute symporter [Virgibacillus sp.]|uniref:sodium:solute symporter family protein n=1 Tax=Virgibacillus sp. TaxID=1872700 RepID=UPI0017BB9398|nr:sodium:solute symporter family protein [Virgibacillus sp.]NWO13870.1 sodium:solute symporter family protein [Virgibacillus sp.]
MFPEEQKMVLGSIVILYFFFLFALSVYINKNSIKTYDDYNLASRNVSLFPIILTFVGTAVGGSTLLGFMENGYVLGMGQQWLNISLLVVGILMAFFLVKKIRKIGSKHRMVTIGDFTALRYGESARIPTVISILIAYCAITGMQFTAIATILNLTIDLSMTTGVVISWVLLTIKTYYGGLKSVIWQDAVHGTIQTVGVFLLFFATLIVAGDFSTISQNAQAINEGNHLNVFGIPTTEVLIYTVTIGGYQFVRQDLWQRYWAASSDRVALRGYWASIILGCLIGAFVIAIGVLGKYGLQLNMENSALIYYEVITNVFHFPIIIIMITALMATVISTADSFFMASSSSVINDLIKPRMKNRDDTKLLKYSRLSVILVSVFALLLSLYIPQIVNLWVTGTAMLVSGLLAPVVFGLFWKGATKQAGISSMWLGLVVAVTWQIAGHPFGIHPVFLGLPISILTLLIVSFLTKDKEQDNSIDIAN